MRVIKFAAAVVALTLASAAHAQTGAPAAPAPAAPVTAPADMMRGPDERLAEFNRLRDDVSRRTPGPTKSTRPIPVSPEDVVAGSEVRDSKGVVIGSIDKVGEGFAVIASPGGKIEVEFDSLAKNKNGLLINMPKSKFDAIVSGGKRAN